MRKRCMDRRDEEYASLIRAWGATTLDTQGMAEEPLQVGWGKLRRYHLTSGASYLLCDLLLDGVLLP